MKKLILFLIVFSLFFISCKEDLPTPDVKLSESSIELKVGQEKTVFLSGGDKVEGFAVTPKNSEIVRVSISGNQIRITALKAGVQTLLISSADKSAGLKVTVSEVEKPIPNLLTKGLGVYDASENSLFEASFLAENREGIWISPDNVNPYSKRIFLPFADGKVGDVMNLSIIAFNVSGFSSGKQSISAKIESMNAEYIQLQSGNFRFVVRKK